MTAVLLEPVPCLRGLDPAAIDLADPRGIIYLLHLDRGLLYAKGQPVRAYEAGEITSGTVFRHYIGWCHEGRLVQRMIDHRTGAQGAKFLKRARRLGVTWHLARVWAGDRREERRIKTMGSARRGCPSCGIIPRSEALRARGRFARRETIMLTIHGSTVRRNGGAIVARLSWGEAQLSLVTVTRPGGTVIGRLVRDHAQLYTAMTAAHQAAPTPSDQIVPGAVQVTAEAAIEALLDLADRP